MAIGEKLCAYCAYMDLSCIKDGKYRCERDGNWRFAGDDVAKSCYKYCEIFWSKLDLARSAIDQSKNYKSAISSNSSCYITTVVVNILGFLDDCPELQVLRWFRTEVMAKNEKYVDLLMKYDIYGPVIAKSLEIEDDIDLAMDLFTVYISGAAKYIQKGKSLIDLGLDGSGYFEAAIELYREMTENLINSRIVRTVLPEGISAYYDQEKGGHGRLQFKKAE